MKQKSTNWWKWCIIVGVIIAAMWGGCEYGIKSVLKTEGINTIVTAVHDTVQLAPIVKTVTRDSIVYRTKHDTLEMDGPETTIPVYVYLNDSCGQFKDVLNDYYSTKTYDSTFRLGKQLIRAKHRVTKNSIVWDKYIGVEFDTCENKTTVLQPKRKAVMTFNLSGLSNMKQFGLGAGFTLTMPNDKTYGLKSKYITGGTGFIYEFELGLPIKLKK